MRDMEILRYIPQGEMHMPSDVRLNGDFLYWEHPMSGFKCDDNGEIVSSLCPTDGCLHDFAALADAAPEQILRFAQTRGVLGILPFVRIAADDRFAYYEPTFAYNMLAGRMRGIIRIMDALKKGKRPANTDMLDASGFTKDVLARSANSTRDWTGLRSPGWHFCLFQNVANLWSHADIKITLAGLDMMHENLTLDTRAGAVIEFGEWGDGVAWDQSHSFPARDRDMMIEAIRAYFSGQNPDHAKSNDELLLPPELIMPNDYNQTYGPEMVIHYLREIRIDFEHLAFKTKRPSALFNVLAFQLLKEVMLPEGMIFCSQCDQLYEYNPDKARKPIRGENSKEWGNSKPRKGRATAFCSEWCRQQYDTEDKRRSRAAAKAKVSVKEEAPVGQ